MLSASNPLDALWLLLDAAEQPLGIVSPAHVLGVVTPLYSSQAQAEAALAQHPLATEVRAAPPLLPLAQQLAALGFAGLLLDESVPLFFVTTRPGSEHPTHVAIPREQDFLLVGASEASQAEVAPWVNQGAFDHLAIHWLLGESLPFVGYVPNMPLFELLPEDEPLLLTEPGLLLEGSSALTESLALFSSEFAAEWYLGQLLGHPLEGDEILGHHDLPRRLAQLQEAAPHAALLLNPGRHRFYQGFFRQIDEAWFLVTINGVWHVAPPFSCTRVARRT